MRLPKTIPTMKNFLILFIFTFLGFNTYAQLSVNVLPTPVTCAGDSNGTALAITTGGIAPYSYSWNTGEITALITGIGTGMYTVTVTDGGNNVTTETTTITGSLGFYLLKSDPICGSSSATGGVVGAVVSGGTLPYTYNWNGVPSTNAVITGLSSGTYAVTISDANGCIDTSSITLTALFDSIEANLILTLPSSCNSDDGTAEIIVQGGSGGYYYHWNTNHSGQTALIDSLSNGQIISVTVVDQNGCEASLSDTLHGVELNYTPTVCNGTMTGFIQVDTILGNAPPYTYYWGNPINQTTNIITGLGPGDYNLVVTDSTNCIDTITTTIANTIITTTATDNLDGTITVEVQGGVAPYSIQWDNGQTTATIGGLSYNQVYQVTVTDVNGCLGTDSIQMKRIKGQVYHDFNQNCNLDSAEASLENQILVINPGNIVTTTNANGFWAVDSLPTGAYTITADTNGAWRTICTPPFTFTVNNPNNLTDAGTIGLYSAASCPVPNISILPVRLRPGFQSTIVVVACNESNATTLINNASIVVELDSLFTILSASVPFNVLGGGKYEFPINPLYPGDCTNIGIETELSPNAILGQILCTNAELLPLYHCTLDTTPDPFPSGITPCNTNYDHSDLVVTSSCNNGMMEFVIENQGVGGMSCFSQVRIFADMQLVQIDSVQLPSGDTAMIRILGDSRTWRLEVDQHPLHVGNSRPSTTIELCGGMQNWTPGLFNAFPQDDANSHIDITCEEVMGSFDPNDKTGYPLGVGEQHEILANQDLEYVIRFQNTGTDTAFNVVIRDTLSDLFNIFSVQSGVSSHPYAFQMHGPRVLEWTFNNIMLLDSNVNEPQSHGFVKFKVKQNPNLPVGTRIENSAAIYFDFNAPIITNTTWHTIRQNLITVSTQKILEEILAIKCYPNPVEKILLIDKMDNHEIGIQLFDNLGRLVMQMSGNEQVTNLNLSSLAKGVYFITVSNNKTAVTQKIIKY